MDCHLIRLFFFYDFLIEEICVQLNKKAIPLIGSLCCVKLRNYCQPLPLTYLACPLWYLSTS